MKDIKKEFNIFALNGDKVSDAKIAELLDLDDININTPEINYELLEKAREAQLKEYPREANEINQMFDKAIYYLKLKLAARGLFHGGEEDAR